jgi:uncharacterized protein
MIHQEKNTPFVYGKIAAGEDFTDREEEALRLRSNFKGNINTILISPRRWGKSSLVKKAAMSVKDKKIIFCFIDLFNVRSEEQFYQLLAQEIIKCTSNQWEERLANTKKFIARFIPKISVSPDSINEFSLGLDWKEVKKNPDDILNLAEKIASANKINIVLCIDEFQNISEFEQPLAFQKKLRAHWQKHQKVCYCLYGSKRHMMMEVFASASMPFYKFGDIIFLQKISEAHWINFIVKRFKDTGKVIKKEEAALIAQMAELHPYYVQQLAQQTWFRTQKKCDIALVHQTFDSLLMQLSLLFQNITESLSKTQINFLHAILDEVEQLSSKETLQKYKLGTSANILKIKEALINKEIIDIEGKNIQFLDPMYKQWLKQYYFTY